MKKGNIEQWKELGNMVQAEYHNIMKIIAFATEFVPKSSRGFKDLMKAYNALINAKSDLENRMLMDLNPEAEEENQKLLEVFYGDYPKPTEEEMNDSSEEHESMNIESTLNELSFSLSNINALIEENKRCAEELSELIQDFQLTAEEKRLNILK